MDLTDILPNFAKLRPEQPVLILCTCPYNDDKWFGLGEKSAMRRSPLLSGLVYSMIFMIFGTLMISLIMLATNVQETSLFGYTMSIHGVSMFIGGIVSGKRSGTRGWYHGGMLGIFYCLIVAIVGFLAYDTGITEQTLYLLGLTFGTGALGGMLGVNLKK